MTSSEVTDPIASVTVRPFRPLWMGIDQVCAVSTPLAEYVAQQWAMYMLGLVHVSSIVL
jgi:hypothetical protein